MCKVIRLGFKLGELNSQSLESLIMAPADAANADLIGGMSSEEESKLTISLYSLRQVPKACSAGGD